MSERLSSDSARGSKPQHSVHRRLRRLRDWVGARPRLRWLYRLLVGLIGGVIVLIGVILIPLPGPGWLTVFVGMAILGSEFPAAARVVALLKRLLTRSWDWWQDRRTGRAFRPVAAVERA
ncbi:MAG: TIGR02611 family protein [Cryobacterium sp.]